MSITCTPQQTAPARAPLTAVLQWMRRRHQQRINRAAFRTLLTLDAHLLRDIGLTRGDVVWGANLPLHRNAAEEVRKCARRGC